MRISTVIVNYRTPKLALRAAESAVVALREHAGSNVVIVDNRSGDTSFAEISEALAGAGASTTSVVESDFNGGFGYGNNVALRRAVGSPTPPDAFWLLNPDTMAEPEAANALVQYLDAHADVGIVGSALVSPDGHEDTAAFRFPTPAGELEATLKLGLLTSVLESRTVPIHDANTGPCDWVSGASMMVRREVFERAGFFDEEIFLYFEEVDLCLRAKHRGFGVAHVRESRVMHVGGAATGGRAPPRVSRHWLESRRHYYRKHHGPAVLAIADAAHVTGTVLRRARRVLQRREDESPPQYLRDFLRSAFKRR